MTKSNKYAGTKGLNYVIAFNRMCELLDKAPLGETDLKFYTEAKAIIEPELIKIDHWDKVKGNLTAKQLLKVLEE